jgi:hypothetical protein
VYFQGPILPADVERERALVYGDRKWRMLAMRFLSCVRRRHSVPKYSLTVLLMISAGAVSVD